MSTDIRHSCQPRHHYRYNAAPLVQAACLALIGLSLCACSRDQELPADVLHSFEAAFTRDDINACMALFADDAQILPEHGELITTQEGIRNYLENQMTPTVSFNTITDMSLVRGDLAVEQGHFKVRDTRVGNDIEWGKYIHIWKKVSGEWRLYRIIYNTDVAQPVEVSVEPAETGAASP